MKTFDPVIREMMFRANACRCGIDPTKMANQAHHIKHNTKINQKRWELFLQSPFNLMPVNADSHLSAPLPKQPSDLVCDVYEYYLQNLKGASS